MQVICYSNASIFSVGDGPCEGIPKRSFSYPPVNKLPIDPVQASDNRRNVYRLLLGDKSQACSSCNTLLELLLCTDTQSSCEPSSRLKGINFADARSNRFMNSDAFATHKNFQSLSESRRRLPQRLTLPVSSSSMPSFHAGALTATPAPFCPNAIPSPSPLST